MYTYILFIIRRLNADFLKLTPIKNILRAVYYFGSHLSKQFPTIAEDENENNGDNKKNGETGDEDKAKRDDGGSVAVAVGTPLAVVLIIIAVIFAVLFVRRR